MGGGGGGGVSEWDALKMVGGQKGYCSKESHW